MTKEKDKLDKLDIIKDKSDIIKILNICVSKDIIKKVKRQLTEWEKILENNILDEGLTFRIYKELLQQ